MKPGVNITAVGRRLRRSTSSTSVGSGSVALLDEAESFDILLFRVSAPHHALFEES
jgi:hypothetical protein